MFVPFGRVGLVFRNVSFMGMMGESGRVGGSPTLGEESSSVASYISLWDLQPVGNSLAGAWKCFSEDQLKMENSGRQEGEE